jgi:phospholipid/cholesterol/gamma-HCH transport system permease protein
MNNPNETTQAIKPAATMHVERGGKGELYLRIDGRLDSNSTGDLWRKAMDLMTEQPGKVVIDAAGIDYCDVSGISLLTKIRYQQTLRGAEFQVNGLHADFQRMLDMFDPNLFEGPLKEKPHHPDIIEQIGRSTFGVVDDLKQQVVFLGEFTSIFFKSLRDKRRTPWGEIYPLAEEAGVNALPLIVMLGFLIGLILSFQSAISLAEFGFEVYMVNITALSLVRELGPLIAAVILAGRTGSAFAAELGTMKVNEELDALSTMGLEPVRYLVLTRVLAAVAVMPFLTIFINLSGLVGCWVVMMSMGYSLSVFLTYLKDAVTLTDIFGGLFKTFVFGILVAWIGCLRGLQTKKGPSAVGLATTQAVVSAIVLVIIADGVFSILYYYLGI